MRKNKEKPHKYRKEPEDNFTPAFKALIDQLDGGGWQIITFEVDNHKEESRG